MAGKFKGIVGQDKDRESAGDAGDKAPCTPAPVSEIPQKRKDRPSGKRRDVDYVQVTAYIHKETHRNVKIALLRSGDGKNFSELVDDLLAEWLKSHT